MEKKKAKVLFFVDVFIIGGVERVLADAVQVLAKDYDVSVLFSGKVEKNFIFKKIEQYARCYFRDDLVMPIGEKPKSFWKRKLWRWKFRFMMFRYKCLAQYWPDFDSFDYLIDFKNGGSYVSKIQKKPYQKTIIWSHGPFFSFKSTARKFSSLKYDRIVCLTHRFQDDFVAKFPAYKDKIFCIYNTIDLPMILEKSVDDSSLSKEEKALMQKPYFVVVSRLDEAQKDIKTILSAYASLLKYIPDAPNLILIGDGPHRKRFENFAQNLELSSKVFFLGSKDNPYIWMKNSLALVLASFFEGLPTVLIEGQACQTLVISSDCLTGPDEILDKGKCGILFPVRDAEALAQILKNVTLGQVYNRQELIANATKELKRFSKEALFQNFERLLK